MKKIISIVGARPQFVKLGPLSKEIEKYFTEIIVHTGQHYDYNMSSSFFKELNIKEPNYFLNVGSGSHAAQTAAMLVKLEEVLLKEKPELIIIYGDTNSTLAGALTGVKLGIRIVHVEAGLRSFNKTMPEEINRIIADHTSDFLFAPTLTAINNLRAEGLINKSYFTGDIMVDSVNYSLKIALDKSNIIAELELQELPYYLLTLHRPYNVDMPENLENIFENLSLISNTIIFPIHPRTRAIIAENKIKTPKNFKIIEPLGYFDFLKLQFYSSKIITDSGGVQKEAYILRKPCITLRTETEWVETVEQGFNLLINHKEGSFSKLIEDFEPKFKGENDIFGQNVAFKMSELLTKII